jgi:hypothetical protein
MMIAAMVAALFMVLGTNDASAQITACSCPNVQVTNNTNCSLTLILEGANESMINVNPNGTGSFACEVGLTIKVQDCNGRLHSFGTTGCVDVVLGDGCCTRVCLEQTIPGCYSVVAHTPTVDCLCN